MTKLTPEQKLENEFKDMFHASIINDATTRKTFIDVMTCAIPAKDVTHEHWRSIHEFIRAVDDMLGLIGYGICDMNAEGGPVHLNEIDQ